VGGARLVIGIWGSEISAGIVVTSLLCDNRFRGGRCEVGDSGLRWEMSVGIAVKK
jgi:hypothetical protein